jgi:sugar lactone lactonase YvrE
MHRVALLTMLAAACNGTSAATQSETSTTTRPATTARTNTSVRIELPGDASGVAWDAGAGLVVTDDTHHGLARLDGERWQRLAAFPQVAHPGLGGLVRLADGRYVTPSFGFGGDGTVFVVNADGAARALHDLDPSRRRSAIARGDDGTLYVGYFVVAPGSAPAGGIARLDLAGKETDMIGGLGKPVGIAVGRDTLYVADEDRGDLRAYGLADPARTGRRIAELPGAHLLTLLPNGDLVTGGKRGAVYRVTPRGDVKVIADGFEQVRGTAYDAAGKRLFVVEHSAASSHHTLHILPLE